MNRLHTQNTREPLHLTALRGLVYAGATFLMVSWLATTTGIVAALAAIVAALAVSRLAIVSRLRWPVVVISSVGLMLLGFWAEPLIGTSWILPRTIGVRAVMTLGEALTFGLITFGLVFGLRTLATRAPVMGGLEVAVVAAVVIGLFAGHRDLQISQPRFFADWVFTEGYNPNLVLLAIGLTTMVASLLLLIRGQTPLKTLATILVLLLLCYPAYLALASRIRSIDVPPPPTKKDRGDKKDKNKDQQKTGQDDKNKDQSKKDGSTSPPPKSDDNSPPDDEPMPFTPPPPDHKPKPAAVVTLRDEPKSTINGLYFRQTAFSQFNNTRLVRAVEVNLDGDVPDAFAAKHEEYPCGPVDPRVSSLVPMTVSLITPHSHPFGLVNVQSMEPRENADPDSFIQTYAVTSNVITGDLVKLIGYKAGDPKWSKEVWDHYLAGPADPRYRELAEKIVAKAIDEVKLKAEYRKSPILRAMAIGQWIRDNTTYTLHPDTTEGTDPTTAFVFGDHRGYCVHVAHAAAYMLRSLGIPARTAGGYHVGAERRGTGSAILVQSTDAHMWPEIYLEGLGWVVVDTSPGRSEEPPPPDVDSVAQNYYGEKNRKKDEPELKDDTPPAPKPSLAWTLLFLLAPLAAMYATKAWWRMAPRMASQAQLYRVCYRSILDRLAEVGFVRRFGETREEFAQRLARLSPEFVVLTEAHVRRAIGGIDTPTRTYWRDLEGQVTREIARTVPTHRRVLGALNPVTWLWVR
jgi:transglutaminase-like putative cysteine protease